MLRNKLLFPLMAILILPSCGTIKTNRNDLTAPKDEIADILEREGAVNSVYQFYDTEVITNTVKKKRKNKLFEKNLINSLELSGGDQELIEKWVNHFAVKDKERFQRMLNRGEVYREVVQNILLENGLPSDLFYLALIESGFVTSANSHASAKGVWQFMKGTGKQYCLLVTAIVDEREDPIRATEAAAKYLRKLYSAYESWELAFAAYNAGEYKEF